MAGNSDLRIKIVGSLNAGKSINEINTAIKGIEKKVNALKLKINVDEKILSVLHKFNNQMSKIADTSKGAGKIIEESLGNANNKAKKSTSQVTDNLNNQRKTVDQLTDSYKKLARESKKYDADGKLNNKSSTYSNGAGNTRTISQNQKGEVTGFVDNNNLVRFEKQQKQLQQQLQTLARTGQYTTEELRKIGKGINLSTTIKQLDQMKNKMANLKIGNNLNQEQERLIQGFKKLFDQGKIGQSTFDKFNNSIKSAKNIKEIEKIEQRLKLVTNSTNNKNFQQKLIGDAQTLLRTHSKTINTQGMKDLIASLKNIKPNAKNASNQLAQLQNQLRSFQGDAREAARSSMTFATMMGTALQKFPIWMAASTAFYAPLQAMESMISRLIEIDSLMVDIQRVMDMPDFKFTELLQEAVNVSDELSSKLTDVLKIMGDFGRMGFKENDLVDISSTAQVLQNISDLDAKSSVDTLTSAMLNFNIAAKDSIMIADQLNEVDL